MKVERGRTVSADGTVIAFERSGAGPTVIAVASSLADRSDTRRLANLLAPHFSVVNYDRRGRGESGDTLPYAVEREIEDLDAVIQEAGQQCCVFGSSSGAVLALEAAARGLEIRKLAVYEPPFVVSPSDPLPPVNFDRRIVELLASGRRAEAVRYFMVEGVGVPSMLLMVMRLIPGVWSNLKAMAHTIPYDLAIMEGTRSGEPLDPDRWAAIKVPTLVMNGGKSSEWLCNAARALTGVLPDGRHCVIKGGTHAATVMAPKKLAGPLVEFFNS